VVCEQQTAEASLYAGLNRALAVTIAVLAALFKASTVGSLDSVNDAKTAAAWQFAPGGPLKALGWNKESHSPLHSPEVGAFIKNLGKLKLQMGVHPRKADAVPYYTAMQASRAILERVMELLADGYVARARETLMAWAANALAFEFFQRGATVSQIDLSKLTINFNSATSGFYAVSALLDLTGMMKPDRASDAVDRKFAEVRESALRSINIDSVSHQYHTDNHVKIVLLCTAFTMIFLLLPLFCS
jgi:hypothetical protein